ncbi:hypothetical protein RYH80_07030 [Halobaculum sp. MBLA0147]|uniref:hypothetical protein n=1 Tax=Halobaculum sp. MBLA0147 TaxID=3079934 RepID=UPI0035249EA6
MMPVELDVLLVPLIVLSAVSYLLLAPYIGKRTALLVVTLKFVPSAVYFSLPKKNNFGLGDGISYYQDSLALVGDAYGRSELMYPPSGVDILVSELDTQHVLYYWWNIVSVDILGTSYHAPILANIFLSVVGGVAFYHFLIESGHGSSYSRYGTVFFLLHWDVLAWTSFTNTKGTMVMLLSLTILLYLIKIKRIGKNKASIYYAVMIAASVATLYWLRFYVPVLITAAAVLWALFDSRQALLTSGLLIAPAMYVFNQWSHALDRFVFESILFGLIRFTLTPQPWSIAPNYWFLQLPAVLHWLFLIPALYGAGRLFIRRKTARILLSYLLVVVVFYSLLPDLWGVRHRYQTVFVWAWIQFHFLWTVGSMVSLTFDEDRFGTNPQSSHVPHREETTSDG